MDRNPPMTMPSSPPARSTVENLAEQLGLHASSSAVFGEPVDRDGVTVVPVAQVRYAFGGGGGEGPQGEGAGSGGGGALRAEPVGYIRISGGRARWYPIVQPQAMARAMVTAMVGIGVGVSLMLWGAAAFEAA